MKITINGLTSGTSATVCKDSGLEYGIVCRRNMDVEKSGHSMTVIV